MDNLLPDPSTLTDEELDAILAGTPPTEEPEEEPQEEPEETPEEEEEAGDEEEEESESEEPEKPKDKDEPKPSRRQELRIQQLIAKFKEEPKQSQAPKQPDDVLDYEKTLDADPELIAKLTEDRNKVYQQAWNQQSEANKSLQFHTRLEIDAPRVHDKYPQLDKSSAKFNPRLADAINSMYLSSVGYDADKNTVRTIDVRYPDYVEGIFELGKEIAGTIVEEKTKVIKKQAAQAGLRPDGSGAKKLNLNQAPQDMSDEELDAVIAAAIPKR